MAVHYKVFDAATSAGNQTISSITDNGGASFTPVAALFWTSLSVTASGFADSAYWCTGFTDGTRQACRGSYFNHDNLTIQFIGQHSLQNETYSENRIIWLKRWVSGIPNTVPTFADISASIVSFGSGQCVINWTAAHSVAFKVHALFLGGTGVSARCSAFVAPSTAGAQSQSVSGVGFTPSGLFTLGPISTIAETWRWGTDLDGARATCFGYVSNTLVNRVTGGFMSGYYTGTTTRYHMSRGACFQAYSLARIFGFPLSLLGAVSSFDADGFGVTWTTLTAGFVNTRCPYLAIEGLEMWVGTIFHPTATGLVQYTDPAIEAEAVILQGCGQNQIASAVGATNQLQWCIGAATKNGTEGCTWAGDRDGVNPTQSAKGERATTKIYMCANASASGATITPYADFEFSQSIPLGFELDATTVDGSLREIFAVVIGDTADVEPPAEPPDDTLALDITWRLHRFDTKPHDEQTS